MHHDPKKRAAVLIFPGSLLGLFNGYRAPRQAESRPGSIGPISLGLKQMGERSAGNPHAAFDAERAGNVARSKRFSLNRRASPRPYLGQPGGGIPTRGSTSHIGGAKMEIYASRQIEHGAAQEPGRNVTGAPFRGHSQGMARVPADRMVGGLKQICSSL
jgi:hypothetical protein